MVPPSKAQNLEPGPGEVVEAAFEGGKPSSPDLWRHKIKTRDRMMKYLKSGERYWYAEEGFGSERRRTKA